MAQQQIVNENEPIEDATIDWSFGQDAYHKPDRIPNNAYYKGVNLRCDKGAVSPRYGYEKLVLEFSDQYIATSTGLKRSIKDVFTHGKFQCFAPYRTANDSYFIIVVNGYVFRLSVRTKILKLLSDTEVVNAQSSRINWSAGGDYLILFDWPNYPLIVQNDNVFRANPNNTIYGHPEPQIPLAATVGTYNQNRLCVGDAGNSWTAGDPTGNIATPEAPITFTEIQPGEAYPNQYFTLGTSLTGEPITAMGFLQSLDQNTQVGPLLVATENSLYYYRTDLPRSQWADPNGTLQFGSLLLFNAGIVGPRAFANVNSDVMFLSSEGKVHALSNSRNDVKTWGNVPISREVENWLTYWDDKLKEFAFVQYYNNRVFISANPYRCTAETIEGQEIVDYANGGMVVLNINSMATLHEEGTPVWDGLWTGIRPMDMNIADKEAYIMAKDNNNHNTVWLMREDLTYDIVDGKELDIESIVETREYFGDSRFVDKIAQAVTFAITNVEGHFEMSVEMRPSQSKNFYPWKSFIYQAPVSQCKGINYFNGLSAHNFKSIIVGATDLDCEDDIYLKTFRKLQLRLRISGRNWSLNDLKLRAIARPIEDRNNICEQEDVLKIPIRCDNYWQIKGLDLCNQ